MRDEFRMLLVEDDLEWRRALREMYEQLVPLHDIQWAFAAETEEAICLLEGAPRGFDLLSLDFLLDGADGRIVLRKAHQLGACRSVVVITGFDQMAEFEAVIEDEQERRVTRMTMQPFIQSMFPHRHLYLKKDLSLTIDENIDIFRDVLGAGRLLSLFGPELVFAREGDSWRIVFGGKESRVVHRLGFSYLAFLLSHPRQHFSCREIEESVHPSARSSPAKGIGTREALEQGLRITKSSPLEEIQFPRTARWNLEREIAGIHDQIQGDEPISEGRRDKLRARQEILEDELKELRNATHKAINDRVTISLRRAVAHLSETKGLEELAKHLCRYLKIGSSCNYAPPDDRRRWLTENGPAST